MSSAPKKPQRAPDSNGKAKSAGSSSALLRGDDEIAREIKPSGAVPVFLVIALGLLFFWGEIYLDNHAGGFNANVYGIFKSKTEVDAWAPRDPTADMLKMGKAKFEAACGVCHQPTGLGSPGQYPPLAGSEWVLGSPDRLIRIPDKGLIGPITVKGQLWNGQMLAMGGVLEDHELAAVLSYIRQAWGNKASIITPAQVKAVREQTAGRTALWTAEELLKVE